MDNLFEQDNNNSTLNEQERQALWNYIEKLGPELQGLKTIAQNPMPLRGEDIIAWSNDVNNLIDKLTKMDVNVNKLMLAKGIIS